MIFCKQHLKHSIAGVLILISSVCISTSYAQDANKKTGSTSSTSVTADNKVRNIDGVAAVVNTGFITRKEIDDRIAALQKQGYTVKRAGG